MTLLKDVPSPRHDPALEPDTARREIDLSGTRLAERGGWTLVWFGVLTGGVSLWHFWWYGPIAAALAPIVILAALAGMIACWRVACPRSRPFQYLTLGAAVVSLAAAQSIITATRAFYNTDSAAFDQIATKAFLHGKNPYTVSMSAVRGLVGVTDRFWTYTIDGGHVAHASYPAGSFLLYAPAMALGISHQVVDWVDLAAWLVTGVLVFALLPVPLRWLGALLLLMPVLVDMGTDATFLPFLVMAVWRWDRFGAARDAGIARWLGPVALGVACATKQMPWFCVPFLALGVAIEARRSGAAPTRAVIRYVGAVVLVFAAFNLPFALWSPGAWVHGTVTPLVEPLVADGQGLVSLATHGLTGGVNLTLLDAAGALAYLTTVVSFALWYPALKRVWPLLLPVAFFFATRSLSSYFVDLLPVALIAATSVTAARAREPDRAPDPSRTPGRRSSTLRKTALVGVLTAGVAITSVLAFSGAPLDLGVRGVTTSDAGRRVDSVTVWVSNDTGAAVTPHFMINTGNNPNGFLAPSGGGPVLLGPHASTVVTLRAPDRTVAPQPHARWLLEAYTVSPKALSTSALLVWSPDAPKR